MTTHDPKLMGYGDMVYEILDGEVISTTNNMNGGEN